MQEKQDECDCRTCRSAALKEKLLFYGWSELGPQVRKTLFKVLCVYIQTDVCDSATIEDRGDIAYHLLMMSEITEDLEEFELKTTN